MRSSSATRTASAWESPGGCSATAGRSPACPGGPPPSSTNRYVHVAADVTSADYPASLARAVAAAGRIDLCVYAAGVGELLDLADLGAQTQAIEVSLLGVARTVEVVVPSMLAAGDGHLIGLSSLSDALVVPEAPVTRVPRPA